jgi:hypothetical protein
MDFYTPKIPLVSIENRPPKWTIKAGQTRRRILSKFFYRNETWIIYFGGKESNEIPLGSLENGLYFEREKKGVFLLQ